MTERRADGPETTPLIDVQAELLHVCRLDLWAEIEGQLRVLNSVLHEIATVRNARLDGASASTPLAAAEDLGRHVQMMKGWVGTLDATVAEADETVRKLVLLLKAT